MVPSIPKADISGNDKTHNIVKRKTETTEMIQNKRSIPNYGYV